MKKQCFIAFLAAVILILPACQAKAGITLESALEHTTSAVLESIPTDTSSQMDSTSAGSIPTSDKGSDSESETINNSTAFSSGFHDLETTGSFTGTPPNRSSEGVGKSTASDVSTSGRTESTRGPDTTTSTSIKKSPWVHPYDIPAIVRECKTEIARVKLIWDDSLVGLPDRNGKPIGLPAGESETDPSINWAGWDNPVNTGVYTDYPSMFSLKNYVFNELIPLYVKNQDSYSLKRCKIWFEPDLQHPGDYDIYFLYRTDPA